MEYVEEIFKGFILGVGTITGICFAIMFILITIILSLSKSKKVTIVKNYYSLLKNI